MSFADLKKQSRAYSHRETDEEGGESRMKRAVIVMIAFGNQLWIRLVTVTQ